MRPSAYSLRTKSSSLRTFSFSEAITRQPRRIVSTGFMTNVRALFHAIELSASKQSPTGKRRYNIKIWKTFIDAFNCLPIAAVVDEKIFCMHGGLSPDLQNMDQIRRVMRPTDVPDTGKKTTIPLQNSLTPIHRRSLDQGLVCDLLWSDPDKDIKGWGENDRGISFTFGPDIVSKFLDKHDMHLICRGHQVVEDGYEFFAKRLLVTLFSAPNYCGEFDNAGAMMSVDETLLCSFQVSIPSQHTCVEIRRRLDDMSY